jgi:putative transposase
VKRKHFSVEQIVAILKQGEVGVPVVELCRQELLSWKKQDVGLEIDQVRETMWCAC